MFLWGRSSGCRVGRGPQLLVLGLDIRQLALVVGRGQVGRLVAQIQDGLLHLFVLHQLCHCGIKGVLNVLGGVLGQEEAEFISIVEPIHALFLGCGHVGIDCAALLTGGGSLLQGMDTLLAARTGMETHLAEDPIRAVALGLEQTLPHLAKRQEGVLNLARRRQLTV